MIHKKFKFKFLNQHNILIVLILILNKFIPNFFNLITQLNKLLFLNFEFYIILKLKVN